MGWWRRPRGQAGGRAAGQTPLAERGGVSACGSGGAGGAAAGLCPARGSAARREPRRAGPGRALSPRSRGGFHGAAAGREGSGGAGGGGAAARAAGLAGAVPRGRCEEGRGEAIWGHGTGLERAEGRQAQLLAGPTPEASGRRRRKEPV